MRFKPFQSLPEALTYGLLVVLLILNILSLSFTISNSQKAKVATEQTKQLVEQNQKAAAAAQAQTLIARQQNVERTNELESYVKCVVLIGKANPGFNFVSATLQQTKALLDQCAISKAEG